MKSMQKQVAMSLAWGPIFQNFRRLPAERNRAGTTDILSGQFYSHAYVNTRETWTHGNQPYVGESGVQWSMGSNDPLRIAPFL